MAECYIRAGEWVFLAVEGAVISEYYQLIVTKQGVNREPERISSTHMSKQILFPIILDPH